MFMLYIGISGCIIFGLVVWNFCKLEYILLLIISGFCFVCISFGKIV